MVDLCVANQTGKANVMSCSCGQRNRSWCEHILDRLFSQAQQINTVSPELNQVFVYGEREGIYDVAL
jgi:hypothetical protein